MSSAIQIWLLAVQVPLRTSFPFFCDGADVLVEVCLTAVITYFSDGVERAGCQGQENVGVACFFGNVGELDFGGGNRLRDASVWGHYVDSYVEFTDVVNIAFL